MTDELTLLRAMRPEVDELAPLAVTRARRSVLRRALSTRRRRGRRLAVAGVAAAAVVALVVGLGLPGGVGRQNAVATQLAAAHLAGTPGGVGDEQYLRIRQVQRSWGHGSPGEVDPWVLERYVPGDRTGTWVERSGEPGNLDVVEVTDWGPSLYVRHSSDPETLLEELRDYAESQDEGRNPHGVWTVAFWITNDPLAPQSFKDDVMRALALLDEVRVDDRDFAVEGLSGETLAIGGRHEVQFVVEPGTRAFRGLVGHPEKDESWVGPEEPMWTIAFETAVVDDLP